MTALSLKERKSKGTQSSAHIIMHLSFISATWPLGQGPRAFFKGYWNPNLSCGRRCFNSSPKDRSRRRRERGVDGWRMFPSTGRVWKWHGQNRQRQLGSCQCIPGKVLSTFSSRVITSTVYPLYLEERHQPSPGIYDRQSSRALPTNILKVPVRNLESGYHCSFPFSRWGK